jgi:hypothetical protein
MSLVLTLLEKAVQPSTAMMQSFENRVPKDNVINAFKAGSDAVIDPQAYIEAKASLRRPVDIAVVKSESYFVNTVRELNPTPNTVTTAKVPLTFVTKTFSFSLSEPLAVDNYIRYERLFQQAVFDGVYSAMIRDNTKSLEVTAIAYLEANKWAIPPASNVPDVAVGTGAYEMDADDYIIKAPVVMRELNMFPRFMDIGNVASMARQRDIATMGRYNQRNLDQYNDQMDFFYSNRIAPTAGAVETHFVVPQDSLGMLNWVEWDARNNTQTDTGRFTTVQDPYFGFDWGVYITKGRADQSADGGVGLERASNIRYDFAASFAFVSPYSSVSGTSPIVKFDLTQV